MQPTPIHTSGPSSPATGNSASENTGSSASSHSGRAVPITPIQAASTKNPKVVLVAGLGILALIMVAVIGILSSINKTAAPSDDLATGEDYLSSSPSASGGASSTSNLTATLPGSGLNHEASPGNAYQSVPSGSSSATNPGTSASGSSNYTSPGSASTWNPGQTLMDPPAALTPGYGINSPDSSGSSTLSGSALTTGETSRDVPSRTTTPARTSTASGSKRYTVQESDTLWKIAQKHLGNGVHWRKIAAANPGLTPEKLRAGMKINLPEKTDRDTVAGSSDRAGSTSAARASTASSSGNSRKSIKVKPGDTLYAIARREYGDGELWDLIYRANQTKLPNPHSLAAGMTIILPAKPAS